MHVAEAVLIVFAAYSVVGVLFAVPFVFVGISRIDETARHAPVLFRLLIVPGAAALWPLLLAKCVRAGRPDPKGTSS